jgi:hypothetical protein
MGYEQVINSLTCTVVGLYWLDEPHVSIGEVAHLGFR